MLPDSGKLVNFTVDFAATPWTGQSRGSRAHGWMFYIVHDRNFKLWNSACTLQKRAQNSLQILPDLRHKRVDNCPKVFDFLRNHSRIRVQLCYEWHMSDLCASMVSAVFTPAMHLFGMFALRNCNPQLRTTHQHAWL